MKTSKQVLDRLAIYNQILQDMSSLNTEESIDIFFEVDSKISTLFWVLR